MRIKSIALQNFISFREMQKIEFCPEQDGIFIIQGDMGHGKSSLLNAFFWCLFDDYWLSDEAKFISQPNCDQYDIFNLGSLKDGMSINFSLKIYLIIFYSEEKIEQNWPSFLAKAHFKVHWKNYQN